MGDGRPGSGGVSRRGLLGGTFVAMTAASLAPARSPATTATAAGRPAGRPNIVLVVADDLGYGEVGAYGQRLIETPTLDRLAAEGVRYTDFHAGGPVCAPSRCTLLTGMHTGHCTVRNNPDPGEEDLPLAEDEVTIGHVFQAAGYRTALFGKWGFGPHIPGHHSHPCGKGFDEFFGYLGHLDAHDYYPAHLWENRERVEIPENADGARRVYAPDLFTERCLDFVRRRRDEPFLLLWATNLPHFPQQVPDLGPYADTDWSEGNKAHAAQITRLDSDIARLIDELEESGIAEETVVFFCGDNGPHEEGRPPVDPDFFAANGPLRGYKRNLLEGGIRVPAIAWAPGLRPAGEGSVNDHTWAMWDLLPTFAELAGGAVPPHVDGVSAAGTLTGEDVEPPRPLYWWRLEPLTTPRASAAEDGRVRQAAEALRKGDWKAVRYAPGRDRNVPDEKWDVELYDLATDVAETVDLAGSHPDVVAELVAAMHRSWTPPHQPGPARFSATVTELAWRAGS